MIPTAPTALATAPEHGRERAAEERMRASAGRARTCTDLSGVLPHYTTPSPLSGMLTHTCGWPIVPPAAAVPEPSCVPTAALAGCSASPDQPYWPSPTGYCFRSG